MGNQIRQQGKSEFDFTQLKVNTHYNIIVHCVWDPFNHFESEFDFLNDPSLDSNTLIILWHAVEQGFFEPNWMAKLDKVIENKPYKLVYLTGCSHRLNVNTVFPYKFDLRFFPVFDIRSAQIWDVNSVKGPQPIGIDKSLKYMYINAKHTDHRKYILGVLLDYGLNRDGVVTYQCYGDSATHGAQFELVRGLTEPQLTEAQRLYNLCDMVIPIKIDNSDFSGSFPRNYFLDSYLNIIGETHFVNIPHGFNTSFVSEKTFNAIANNQMFIVVGHAGSLDLLRSLGYKTFDGVIDETYDTIVHNGDRLGALTKEISRFLSRPLAEIRNDYIKVQDIIEYNRNLLFSQSLEARLQNLIDTL